MHGTGLSPISGMTQKQVNGLEGNSEVILVGGEASGNRHRPTQVVKEEGEKLLARRLPLCLEIRASRVYI